MSILPSKKSTADKALGDRVVTIYGRPKIGKSTICSEFPDVVFFATEPGLDDLEVYPVYINSWKAFLDACRELAKGEHKFKTVVIDTIDNLVDYCSEYVCNENEIDHPGDMAHGKGWSLVTNELRSALYKLSMLPYGLVMVSHCELKEMKTKTKTYNKASIPISGKNGKLILKMSDLILYVDSEEEKDGSESRVIRTKPTLYWDAGDRSRKLPDTIPAHYKDLEKYFRKEGKEK